MLLHDYLDQQIEFEKKYGEDTLVLMQVGSFFEFYGVDNKEERIGRPKKVAELLNIQLTRRNKAILENSRNNCLMAGFPTHSLKRFVHILLQSHFTIVLIEQVTPPPNPKREITQIFSPGTYIDDITNFNPNNIVSLYVSQENCYKTHKEIYVFGLSAIDLSTGKNYIYEAKLNYFDKNAFFEEIYRFIETFQPKEIIIIENDFVYKDWVSKIHTQNRLIHFKKIEAKHQKIHYQNSFLETFFESRGFYSPIEYLHLEQKPFGIISYIFLLEFSFEHNERITQKINTPQFWNYDDHLILYHNALYQLNIVSLHQNENHKYKSLFHIIDKTRTPLGKRFLLYNIHNPSTNVDVINKRYELIQENIDKRIYVKIEKWMNEIIDIERIHRKIALGKLHPFELYQLCNTYENIHHIIDLVRHELSINDYFLTSNVIHEYKEYISFIQNTFEIIELGKYNLQNISGNLFKRGQYQEIDEYHDKVISIFDYYNKTMKELSNLIDKDSDYIKLEKNERDGYFLVITKKRSELLVKALQKQKNKDYEIKKHTSTNVKICSKTLHDLNYELVHHQEKIKEITKEKYFQFLQTLYEKYHALHYSLSQFIMQLDFIQCGARVAIEHQYCRPKIVDDYNSKSYFDAQGIRHPIIEIIQERHDYVSNDIRMDHNKNNGFLLYGINGVGKSSLSKAIGCNLVLAQMGFFVASAQFQYWPYAKIFTRINGDDNIFKGMSSFVVEMDELRSILTYSDSQSIVLGDEICKGTEETSALAIVSASILRFCKKEVQFIMATHFHKLMELEEIRQLKNIHCKHLSIEYKDDQIIYGRKLLDGCGSNLYGVEIADYIIQDKDFIQDAKKIRNKILGKPTEVLEDKKSNYNTKLYVKKCSICGKKEDSLDTHHIIEQHEFKENNIFKNKLSNLVILCKKHHHEVHHGLLTIHGYENTSKGCILQYEYCKKEKVNKKKYDEIQVKLIKDLYEDLKDHKNQIKVLLQELKRKDIVISRQTVQKIVNNQY